MIRCLHVIYTAVGHVLAWFLGVYWAIRDTLCPPKEHAVLFVAHPDDDALFFHSFIKANKPYVVLMTTGGIIRRVFPFFRAMKAYGVRYRAYDLPSKAVEQNELIKRRVAGIFRRSHFRICATHNSSGEYGHIMHKCLHDCVNSERGNVPMLIPFEKEQILNHPLSSKEVDEKEYFLRTYYHGEYPTLQTFGLWIDHEGLYLMKD